MSPAPLPGHAEGCTCDGCMIAFGCGTPERDQAIGALLDDIREQYERRQRMFASAGGDPAAMQGSLTAYLEYELLRRVFEPKDPTRG